MKVIFNLTRKYTELKVMICHRSPSNPIQYMASKVLVQCGTTIFSGGVIDNNDVISIE